MQPCHSSGTKITIGIVNVEAFNMKLTDAYQVYRSIPKSTPIVPRSDNGLKAGETYFKDTTNNISVSLAKYAGPAYVHMRQGMTRTHYIFTSAYNIAAIRGVCEQAMKLPTTDGSYTMIEVHKAKSNIHVLEMIKVSGTGDLLIQKRNAVR